jgi:APA family basic amino acid/polyamine antiporter
MSSTELTGQGLNQENLKRTIGLPGAVSVALNQIIGGGIVSLTGAAIAITGGGVAWAYGTAVFTILLISIPYSSIGAAMPVTGGVYTWSTHMLHPAAGFFSMWLWILSQVSLSLYGLAAGEYLHALNPLFSPAWVAVALVAIFFIANLMGAAISSRVGVAMIIIILLGFLSFIAYGLGQVHWQVYPTALPHGFLKLIQAAALLTFATGGGTGVAELGHELKRPGRDIPIAMIGGTGLIGILYVLIALPAAGVLPISKVSGQPLSTVAHEFMPHGLWVFFILGGAMLAVISTLNAQLLWGSKSLLAACDDGWLPKWLGTVNKRFGTPHYLLTLLFIVGILPAITGFDISDIGSAASAFAQIIFAVIVVASLRLRYVRPDLHRASPFRLNKQLHWILTIIGVPVALYQAYLLIKDFNAAVAIAALVWMALGAILFAFRYGTVKRTLAARRESETSNTNNYKNPASQHTNTGQPH